MIKRIYDDLQAYMRSHKALIIYGPRNVGKTTLLRQFLDRTPLKYKLDSGDNIRTRATLSSQDFSQILSYVEGYELIAIDEAQQIPGIGMALKIIIDQAPDVQIIATGSSSFDLSQQIGEPLTGRKKTLTLYPISQLELLSRWNRFELQQKLEEFLIFGSYPEVITTATQKGKVAILKEIVESYLLKDIIAFENIKSSSMIFNLLKLLAFQVGSEVSWNELAVRLGIDVKTVARYLDLLEKAFVIAPLGGYRRNLRSEITSKHKYYFFDTGIRNGVISQFNKLTDRDDKGQLFENFVVMERVKKRAYQNILRSAYFWRTYGQQEVDLVEEGGGKLDGYEIRWSSKKPIHAPKDWVSAYPGATFTRITTDNYIEYIV